MASGPVFASYREATMDDLFRVTVDFDTSHLLFPRLIAIILAILGIGILISKRREIVAASGYWRSIFSHMDKVRFFGTVALTILYFSLMVPVGDFWPNTGLGFLICSIPYILLTGLLFMHERSARTVIPVVLAAVTAPVLVWWLFTDLFFLTLP